MKKDSLELGYCTFCKTESVRDRHISFEVCPTIFAYFFIKIVDGLLMEISLVAPVDILPASIWTVFNSSFSYCEQLSQIMSAFSNNGRIKAI